MLSSYIKVTYQNSYEVNTTFMENNIVNKGIVSIKGNTYNRLAIKTHFIQRKESYLDLVRDYILPHYEEGDVLLISEKIISISQDRVVEKSSVHPGFWAKLLSKFVMKTTAGYSVGNVYKMQVAIQLAGLPRILFAAFCSAVTKPFGIRGVFYRVAGNGVNGIDGFYGEAFKEYEQIGILNPVNPDKVCNEIEREFNIPTAIVDCNDLGCNVFGVSDNFTYSEEQTKILLQGNPAGQSNQQTPFILIKSINEFDKSIIA